MRDTPAAAARARVIVLGSINVDLGVRVPAFPQPGETVVGGDLIISPGGKGANQAVAAALAGADVTMLGAVGSDRFAEVALAGLRRAGVDLSRVRSVHGATGTALITVDAAGENTIIVSPGANGQVGEADADAATALLDTPAAEGSGIRADGGAAPPAAAVLVLQGEIAPRVVDRCVAMVRGRSHIRALVNAAPVTDLVRATLEAADPLVVNESEARLIARQIGAIPAAGDGTDGAVAELVPSVSAGCGESPAVHEPRDAMAAVAASLVEWGVPAVVLTLGAQGSLVAEREERSRIVRSDSGQSPASVVVHRVEPSPARVVDTTGAGDMFVGSLAAHLAEGCGLVEAAQAAAVRAAASVEQAGAQSSNFAADDARTS